MLINYWSLSILPQSIYPTRHLAGLVRRRDSELWTAADNLLDGYASAEKNPNFLLSFSIIVFDFFVLIFEFWNFCNFLNFQRWSQLSFDMLWTSSSLLPFPITPILRVGRKCQKVSKISILGKWILTETDILKNVLFESVPLSAQLWPNNHCGSQHSGMNES